MKNGMKAIYINGWTNLKLPTNKARTAYLIRDAEEEKEYENEIFECGKIIIIFREVKEKPEYRTYFKVADGINTLKDLEEHTYEEISTMEVDI